MNAVAAERTAKDEDQLLEQPANAEGLHGAITVPPQLTSGAQMLAALIQIVCDSPQVWSRICRHRPHALRSGPGTPQVPGREGSSFKLIEQMLAAVADTVKSCTF